jgi:hypothetical protein
LQIRIGEISTLQIEARKVRLPARFSARLDPFPVLLQDHSKLNFGGANERSPRYLFFLFYKLQIHDRTFGSERRHSDQLAPSDLKFLL